MTYDTQIITCINEGTCRPYNRKTGDDDREMELFMQKIIDTTTAREKTTRNRLLLLKLGCTVIVALLLACLSVTGVSAASGLKIYDYQSKKNVTYTGKQVKVTLNGEQISKDDTPGIIMDGIALLSYKDIFANSPIKAKCVYNKPEGTVTIKGSGTTIVLTINSKTAVVNGKKVKMPVAPIKIKYRFADVTKILVPSRFVAETLGYKYTWNSSNSTAAIEGNPFMISINDGKEFAYTGSIADVTIDGTKVSPGNMPSLIIDNITMVRAKRVFADSKVKAKYSFDSKEQTITLSKDENVLKMKIGKKTADLNGKSVKMNIAPMIVTNHNAKSSFVMVPGSFTASALGYDYSWNQSKRTSEITTRKEDSSDQTGKDDSETGGDPLDPELGDDSVINEKGTILRQWRSNEALLGKGSNVHEIAGKGQATEDIGTISVNLSNVNQKMLNVETYQFPATMPYGEVTSGFKNKVITIRVPGMNCTTQTNYFNETANSVIEHITTKYDSTSKTAIIEITVRSENISYDISLSADRMNLYVNLYKNSITSATVGTNSKGDYITLNSLRPLEVMITNQGGYLTLDLPYTINGIGDQYASISGSKYVNQFFTVSSNNGMQAFIELKNGADYYIIQNGNWYTLSIQPKGTIVEPEPPKEDEEKPSDINKDNYEIRIPRPADIRSDMISDEDYYYKKQFAIKLSGDYTSYFNTNPVIVNSSIIRDVTVKLNADYQTEICFTTSKLQGYEYVMDDSYIYVNIDIPKNIYKNIVVLDPGHGGGANGAQYFNTKEKDLNCKMLYTLGKKYFDSDTSKIKAYYTRVTDKDVDLYDRAGFAKEVGADLFVSLHMNASTSKSANGTEVYYSSSNNEKNRTGLNSSRMASMFVNNLSTVLGTNNRGISSARYVVVHRNTVPAVLIELGFMSNQNDFNKISNASYQETVAKTIYETLCNVFEQYPTGR
ncbi:MAG TPA: hypothetical protein DHW85_05050 [Lachnospiraceae bacterium]|jgi:N-acetylmuramoyl-L-alanine amidase|nr:hypothetical protein [Lachnospiraceae bacterium]